MEHAKKMILVEPRVLESMQQQQQQQQSWDATTENLKERDREMKEILDDDRDTHDKANAYQQALWRFLNRFEQYKDRPLGRVEVSRPSEASTSSREREGEGESGTAVERDVVASVPRSMRSKAERLLQRLKADPEVKWNDLGEFEYRGRVIKRSNLTDLVNDVLRKRRSVNDPQGWETFAQVLQRINVPQDLVGNTSRWRYMQQQQTSSPPTPQKDQVKEEEEGERFETPLKTTPTKWSKKEARSERKRQKRKSRKGLLWESM